MRLLVVTGTLALDDVKRACSEIKDVDITIKSLDYPVAALMSVRYIAEKLKDQDLKGYDIILVPGLVYGDCTVIEEKVHVPTFKGTEEAADIPLVIDALKRGITLSKKDPADRVIDEMRKNYINKVLELTEVNKDFMEVNGLRIPLRPPPFRIFLEVSQSSQLEEIDRVKRYVDVIVVGTPVGSSDPSYIKEMIKRVLDTGFHAAVDSDSILELKAGIEAGASFVFNLNEINIERLTDVKKDATFVVAPFSRENKLETVSWLLNKASDMGYTKIIGDPVMAPPLKGVIDSLYAYKQLSVKFPNIPFLMGTLNITELIDVDSHGVNGLLTALAVEAGTSCLLTMEKGKTKWSSWELKRSGELMAIAQTQGRFPKDIGVDLLLVKDKRKSDDEEEPKEIVEVVNEEPVFDREGFVKIWKKGGNIYLTFYGKDKFTLKGRDALSIGRTLLRKTHVSPQHALYIGYELAKAEIARDLDKNYVQDRRLFRRIGE
ncbi:dihydropteroate synthase [Sulfolobales archaeon HS-7]|nr:dihydropteroate synthase [Sulfolobales archaeon HS-7]